MWSLLVLKFKIKPSFSLLLLYGLASHKNYASITLILSLICLYMWSYPSLCKCNDSDIRDLRRIRCYVDHNNAVINATSLIQSRLDYCNSHCLNLPAYHSIVCNSFSMLLLMLLLENLNSLASFLLQNAFTCWKLMNAYNLRFSLLPTKFSKIVSRSACVIFSLFSLLQVLIVPPMLLLIFALLLLGFTWMNILFLTILMYSLYVISSANWSLFRYYFSSSLGFIFCSISLWA
jgi:hypothetical protein